MEIKCAWAILSVAQRSTFEDIVLIEVRLQFFNNQFKNSIQNSQKKPSPMNPSWKHMYATWVIGNYQVINPRVDCSDQ
jgi:hypothetical protein